MWHHVQAGLDLLAWMPEKTRYFADLGSGQGFPGIVIAIATGVRGVLIEADRRKAAFLRHAVMELGVSVDVVCGRAEHVQPQNADWVTACGLGPASLLIDFGMRHAAPHGSCAFPKGPELENEMRLLDPAVAALWRRLELQGGKTLLLRPPLIQ